MTRFTEHDANCRLPVRVVRPDREPIEAELVYAPPPPGVLRPNGDPYSQRAKVRLPSGKHLSVKPEYLERL